jgi:uncharacterized protein with HEPN domain
VKDDKLYLRHILECSSKIKEYTHDGREKFLQSGVVQDAVLRNLQIMTESPQHLSAALKERHAEVDWRGLSGFQNILVHDYLGVDLEIVWTLVDEKPSGLVQAARVELASLNQ